MVLVLKRLVLCKPHVTNCLSGTSTLDAPVAAVRQASGLLKSPARIALPAVRTDGQQTKAAVVDAAVSDQGAICIGLLLQGSRVKIPCVLPGPRPLLEKCLQRRQPTSPKSQGLVGHQLHRNHSNTAGSQAS